MLYAWILAILCVTFEVIRVIFYSTELSYIFFPAIFLVLFPFWRYIGHIVNNDESIRDIGSIRFIEALIILIVNILVVYVFSLTFPVWVIIFGMLLSLFSYTGSHTLFLVGFLLFIVSIFYLLIWFGWTAQFTILYATYSFMAWIVSVIFSPTMRPLYGIWIDSGLWKMYIKDISWMSCIYTYIFPLVFTSICIYIYFQQPSWYLILGTSLPTILVGLLYLISIFRDIPLNPSKKYLPYNL
jgi:hypothetical protein